MTMDIIQFVYCSTFFLIMYVDHDDPTQLIIINDNNHIIICCQTKKAVMEFDYTGKTAVEALQGICLVRQYPQPIFLDRSPPEGNIVIVTAVVGGRAYGSGEGQSSFLACEKAAMITLSAWLKEAFQPHLIKAASDAALTSLESEESTAAGDGAQSNALSIFNLYVSAVVRDVATKPDFCIKKSDDGNFHCVLKITIDSKIYRAVGDGRTKVLAKRLASQMLLK
jgi:hypothetical protein